MTQEEKELLLKDLCARLPYGVVVQIINKHPVILGDGNESDEFDEPYNVSLTIGDHDSLVDFFNGDWVTDIKPYLRPMSSMTDEEREVWADLFNLELDKLNEIDDEDKAEELAPYYFGKSHQVSIDWLNTHHFDYRSLIPMGLALEAPEDMYKVN